MTALFCYTRMKNLYLFLNTLKIKTRRLEKRREKYSHKLSCYTKTLFCDTLKKLTVYILKAI